MINTIPRCRVFWTVKNKMSFSLDFHMCDVLILSDNPKKCLGVTIHGR